jgi:TolA-binding protein
MRSLVSSLSTRLDAIESRMGSLNDKVDATKAGLDVYTSGIGGIGNKGASTKAGMKKQGVTAHPADGLGANVPVDAAAGDPESGFNTDEAILSYRRANVLFQAGKYPESVLAFSNFVDKNPDHPLAGSAQYYVGASYLRQKEYRLASQEFERVLTSYDRSPRISDTLRDLAEAEDGLKKPKDAARHRQLLLTMFPQSPAASGPAPELQHDTRSRAHPTSAIGGVGAVGNAGAGAPASDTPSSDSAPPTAPLSATESDPAVPTGESKP